MTSEEHEMRSSLTALAAIISVISQVSAQAQVSISGKTLPLSTAIIAAQTAARPMAMT